MKASQEPSADEVEDPESTPTASSSPPTDTDLAGRQNLFNERESIIQLTTNIVARLREGTRLIDQDTADSLEISLINDLRELPLPASTDPELLSGVYRQLADLAARNRARRLAVAVSWWRFDTSSQTRAGGTQLGGYEMHESPTTNLERLVLHRRRVERIAETLWDYASAATENTAAYREQLVSLLKASEKIYGLGPVGEYFRADNLDTWLPESSSPYVLAPGTQWHAGWEQEAVRLAEREQ